jgi:parallel beta-helix repeat protein
MPYKLRFRGRPRKAIAVTSVAIVLAVAIWAGFQILVSRTSQGPERLDSAGNSAPQASPTSPGTVCGQSALRSPFTSDGPSGDYESGSAGLPTYGGPGTNFPNATAGVVLPAGAHNYFSYNLHPNTVYYLQPGLHFGFIQADTGDVFIGGYYHGQTSILSGQYHHIHWGIDSNPTDGDQANVIIEFLTVEKYQPNPNAAALNQDSNTGWLIKDNTIISNVPGAGAILGSGDSLVDNCLTRNGQYGFQSVATEPWSKDPLTTGPDNILIQGNEMSHNDICDFEGKLNNPAIGWSNHDPIPPHKGNAYCGTVTPSGDQGGFKLWETNNATVASNYIHDNYGPGAWADTNDANTTITGNRITGNDDAAIIEEASYNFAITNNYLADNDWAGGLGNRGYPQPAIYISESGSDTTLGGVPGKYSIRSIISGNTLVNNGGGVFLWQNSNRYCSDGADGACTLVRGGATGPFTSSACHVNLPSAALSTTTFAGSATGSPLEDWWDGCLWRTENVLVTANVIDFNPAAITGCTAKAWPDCGANGVFSEYGSPPNNEPGWVVPTDITFFQNNSWTKNIYNGPSTFYAWNQGNDKNPVSWAEWTESTAKGDKCSSAGERTGGYCVGPFGQDSGSSFR